MSNSRRRLMRRLKEAAFYVLVITIVCVVVFPIVWTALTSFKLEKDAFAMPPKWLFKPTLVNYSRVFSETPFLKYIGNSLLVAGGSTALVMLIGVPAAYGLTRFRFRGAKDLSFYILSTRIAPPLLVLFPFFMLFTQLNLIDSYIALITVYVAMNLSFVVWMMQSFFREIPQELDEAALIDGCNYYSGFLRVVLPLALPGLTATTIFSFIMAWNEFLFALILTGTETKTLPVAITSFIDFQGTNWGKLSAGGTIIMLPILVFGFLVQKRLVKGLTMGAIK